MRTFHSRIPSEALRFEIDGHLYAYVPHTLRAGRIVENYKKPRMVRYVEPESFTKNGEAYVYIGRAGDLVNVGFIPYGVTVSHT